MFTTLGLDYKFFVDVGSILSQVPLVHGKLFLLHLLNLLSQLNLLLLSLLSEVKSHFNSVELRHEFHEVFKNVVVVRPEILEDLPFFDVHGSCNLAIFELHVSFWKQVFIDFALSVILLFNFIQFFNGNLEAILDNFELLHGCKQLLFH